MLHEIVVGVISLCAVAVIYRCILDTIYILEYQLFTYQLNKKKKSKVALASSKVGALKGKVMKKRSKKKDGK